MTPELTKIVLSLGFPGVVILILAWVVFKLDKRNQDMVTARISEAKESLQAFNRSTDAIDRNTDAIKAQTELIRVLDR